MPTVDEIVAELKKLGNATHKRIFTNHGAKEPFFGVSIADLKKIQKRIKKDQKLALALYDTGISDAQYLAALISDPPKFTKSQLQKWAKTASWHMVNEYTVAWAASESRFGFELGREWIDSKNEDIATSGWSTLASVAALKPDEELDLDALVELLKRVEKGIHSAPNHVRYVMNGFVIAVGCYVAPLTAKAKAVAKAIGKVECELVGSCKLPNAVEYIAKVEKAGRVGRKRKTAMC